MWGLSWIDAGVAVVIVALLIVLWRVGKRKAVKKIILNTLTRIDAAYDATPDDVFLPVYRRLPKIVRMLYSLQEIRSAIDDALATIEASLQEK